MHYHGNNIICIIIDWCFLTFSSRLLPTYNWLHCAWQNNTTRIFFLFVKLYFQLAWRVFLQWPTCVVSLSCFRHVFCQLWQTVTFCLVNSCTIVQVYLGATALEFLSSVTLITPVFFPVGFVVDVLGMSCTIIDTSFFVDWRDCDTRLFGPLSVLCFLGKRICIKFFFSCLIMFLWSTAVKFLELHNLHFEN